MQNLKFRDGIIPVITQDVETKEVLMLAYANEEAIKKTIETGFAHYWSRSRKKLWKKGETSGNVQKVVEIRIDCDNDALLYLVKQKGVACHTGNYSCFYRRLKDEVRD
ncbi:phosphoribosyl-AMP cyclohydrolase [Archaeoglobales archaeon]|nr:MAG: phosphoribosyl-AMP cyclohydrolase [Archaeoglobales archaeon]